MTQSRYTKRRGKKPRPQDPFEEVTCYVPKVVMGQLREEAERLGVPLDRLLVRAALGVLNRSYTGFEYDLSVGDASVDGVTIEHERQLYEWLSRADIGLDLDLVLMSHEDAGFEHLWQMRGALRMLLVKGLIEIYNHPDYAIPKVRHLNAKRLKRKDRFLLFGGEKVEA